MLPSSLHVQAPDPVTSRWCLSEHPSAAEKRAGAVRTCSALTVTGPVDVRGRRMSRRLPIAAMGRVKSPFRNGIA